MSANGNANGNGMEATNGSAIEERRRSFGIGGAGNIRRPSEVWYPPRRKSTVIVESEGAGADADGSGEKEKPTRRRSSGWSMGTSPGKGSAVLSFFRKGS